MAHPRPDPPRTAAERWDAQGYDARHGYVWQHGAGVVDLLAPQPGERILDLGCGTGHLSHTIAERGSTVIGLDNSASMIQQARLNYPALSFVVADGASFQFDEPFDAVFSNAALHWIHDAPGVVASVWRALRPGGRFAAEFGGQGNVARILLAVREALQSAGYTADHVNPWYFPSVGEYATLLEAHGFTVRFAALFDRPTPLDSGAAGLRNWLDMFAAELLSPVPNADRSALIHAIEAAARAALYHDGTWVADYRRLRIVALREPV